MSIRYLAQIALVAAMLSGAAHAAEIEGVKLADRVKQSDAGPELMLNGAGVRTRVFFKVYVGALYLQNRQTATDAVLADHAPRRVALHMLRELTSEQLVAAFNDALLNNHAPEQLAPLDARLKEFNAIFNTMKAVKNGDVILIDYVPAAGTRVAVNGETKGTIAGEDFNKALLRIWLGDKPVDANLKKAMLGG